ncbi:MAG TPA: GatB/YqeY domain-containing protein [Candidatus Polarisedimenticolia bacterium]|nr:GatB/YqeY domain-containing protein [Candidatus Polarisedimenticolia bacterium]
MIDRIQSDLKQAMKSGDKTTLSVLRMLLSSLKYAAIDQKRDLDETEAAAVIQRAIRSRKESIEAFRAGGRADLAEQETRELAVLERYLPAQMEGAELERVVDELLAATGITEKKDLGRAMKEFMARHKGKADGKAVNALIASRLR